MIVVEHDLSVLDYLSDFVCCLYGKPGHYGVVTLPFSVREGMNFFLTGSLPTKSLRFTDEPLDVSPILLLLACSIWATEMPISRKSISPRRLQRLH